MFTAEDRDRVQARLLARAEADGAIAVVTGELQRSDPALAARLRPCSPNWQARITGRISRPSTPAITGDT